MPTINTPAIIAWKDKMDFGSAKIGKGLFYQNACSQKNDFN